MEEDLIKDAIEDIVPKIEVPDDISSVHRSPPGSIIVVNGRYKVQFSMTESPKFHEQNETYYPGITLESENVLVTDTENPDKLYKGNLIFTYHTDNKIWSKSLFLACINDKSIEDRLLSNISIEI